MNPVSKVLIDALEAAIRADEQPTEIRKTRDGWAGYKGTRRITKFCFAESTARDLAADYDSESRLVSPKPVTFVDPV